jgi:uncharacterized membrane protein YfcA
MHAGLLRDVLSLLLGFLTGVLSALFGIGGAIVSNPGLRALGAAPLLAVVGGSLLSHAVPGEGHLLLLIIALLLAFTAWRTAFTRGVEDDPSSPAGAVDNPAHLDPRPATLPLRGASQRRGGLSRADTSGPGSPGSEARQRRVAAGIGLVAGLLSGLLGIGGGVVMVPAFSELLSLSLKSAIATSLVCVGIFGVPAAITHALLGDVDWRLAILLMIGVIPGAWVGASLTLRTAERRLRLAVGGFLAVVALVYLVTETRALLAL